MKNWLGQEIEVGSIVARGENRTGADIILGRVFAGEGKIARVHWLYYPSYKGERRAKQAKSPGVPQGGGPISVDRLVLVDPASLDFDPNEWWD